MCRGKVENTTTRNWSRSNCLLRCCARIKFRGVRYTHLPHGMRRSILFLVLGIFCTFLLVATISVYVFHDVDQDETGDWNGAFAGLAVEGVLFTAIVGGGVALLALLGRSLFHLKGHSPRPKLGLILGIAITALQYPWDWLGRAAIPKLADFSLGLYLVLAIVFCSVIIVRDNYRQMKLSRAPEA